MFHPFGLESDGTVVHVDKPALPYVSGMLNPAAADIARVALDQKQHELRPQERMPLRPVAQLQGCRRR